MLYTNIGQVVGVSLGIKNARQEAAASVSQGVYTATLIIDEKEFKTGNAVMNDSKEINYQGKLYDILSCTRQNGKVILKVLRDKKEETMLSSLREIIETWTESPAKSNSKQPSLRQMVVIKDFLPSAKFSFNYLCNFERVYTGDYSFPSGSPLITVLKSPPQIG